MRKQEKYVGWRWVFFGTQEKVIGEKKEKKIVNLINANSIPIRRHLKIKMKARLYDPKYVRYFEKRKQSKKDDGNNSKLYHYHFISKLKLFDEKHWQ